MTENQNADDDAADGCLRVRKVETTKGEQLRVSSPTGHSIQLDALVLESIAWQDDADAVVKYLSSHGLTVETVPKAIRLVSPDGKRVRVSNEYTHVTVREPASGNLLVVESLGLDYEIALKPTALEYLARQENSFVFSDLLRTPFGPEDIAEATKLVRDE
jgi:hypothetical protein